MLRVDARERETPALCARDPVSLAERSSSSLRGAPDRVESLGGDHRAPPIESNRPVPDAGHLAGSALRSRGSTCAGTAHPFPVRRISSTVRPQAPQAVLVPLVISVGNWPLGRLSFVMVSDLRVHASGMD